MSDWQSDLRMIVEEFALGMSDLVQEVSQETVAVLDRAISFSLEVSETVVQEVTQELENLTIDFSTQTSSFLDTDMDTFLDTLLYPLTRSSLEDWINASYAPPHYENPISPHALCAGCKHFHGHSYNGVPFVCGMHPYGIEDGQDRCDDREINA